MHARRLSHLNLIYSQAMDVSGILREIDAEIAKLKSIRNIVAGLVGPVRSRRRVVQPPQELMQEEIVEETAEAAAEPALVVLPPRQRREYRARTKTSAHEPRALGSSVPDRPVFVPKVVAAPVVAAKLASVEPEPEPFDAAALEAALRQRFISGAA